MIGTWMFSRPSAFWMLAFCVMTGLTLPVIIKDGMFMDANLYSTVSHNLSMGIGTFWFPQFSLHNIAGLPSFHEQPPLVFGIQSIFYRIFGDSMYVERLYTFTTLLATAWLIKTLWTEIYKDDNGLKQIGWLPLILWITIPLCFWSYSNNMHENTMGIFTLTSVLFICRALHRGNNKIIYLLLAGTFIFLATFSKGIPGFFPVAVPILYFIFVRRINFSAVISNTLILIIPLLVLYSILFLIPETRESLSMYLFKRAFHRITSAPTVDSRWYTLFRLLLELLPAILLALSISIFAKRKQGEVEKLQIKEALFFISIGLCGSLPLMITMVQKGFYFVPSLPFFAIGLSMLIANPVRVFVEQINIKSDGYKIFSVVTLCLLFSVLVFTWIQKGKTTRDKEILHDVYLTGQMIPKFSVIGGDMSEWGLQIYLIRYFNISLDPGLQNEYYIIDKSAPKEKLTGYKKVDIVTEHYDIYKRL